MHITASHVVFARTVPRVRFGAILVLGFMLAASCGGGSSVPAAKTAATVDTILPTPAESLLTNGSASASVVRGLALLTATRDSLPAHVGNELRCTSCHLNKGRKPFGNTWVGVSGRYPSYFARVGATVSLEDRINECFVRSLNGKALAAGSADLRDIVAYMTWLSSMVPAGGVRWGLAVDSLAPLPPDTVRGKSQFAMYCARCHGADGQSGKSLGIANPGPPLWGKGSFSVGSDMSRSRIVAAFVHHHMPFDAPGFVADSISYDVAGFILTRPRPDFAGKELDWPKGDAPPDLAYKTKGQATAAAPKKP